MKFRTIALFLVLVWLASLAAFNSIPMAKAGIQGPGSSNLSIVNLDTDKSAVSVTDFYNQRGGGPVAIVRPGLRPLSAGRIDPFEEPNLTNGAYGAITSSDRQIALQSRVIWPFSGGTALVEQTRPAFELSAAYVPRQFRGQTSLIALQNLDTSSSVEVELVFHAMDTPGSSYTSTLAITPGTSSLIDIERDPRMSTMPFGLYNLETSAVGPVAGEVIIDIPRSEKGLFEYVMQPKDEVSTELLGSLILNDYGAWGSSGFYVYNPSNSPNEITVRFTGIAGSCSEQKYSQGPIEIPGQSGMSFVQYALDSAEPDLTGLLPSPTLAGVTSLPKNCAAVAFIEGSEPSAWIAASC